MEKADWQNFYLQRMGTDSDGKEYPSLESVSDFGVWCKKIPFILIEKAKDPAKRVWHDEHGDDEFLPPGGLYMDAYSMEVEFGCKTMYGVADVREKVGAFLRFIRTAGMMYLYSSYTRVGRQNVRFSSVSNDSTWETHKDGREFLIFKVQFKVNDPVTDIIYKDGSLVEA